MAKLQFFCAFVFPDSNLAEQIAPFRAREKKLTLHAGAASALTSTPSASHKPSNAGGEKRRSHMGGQGSGRIFHFSKKPVLEDYRNLDVRRLSREGLLGKTAGFAWTWSRNGAETGRIDIATTADSIRLCYRIRRNDGPWQSVDDIIRLTTTSCGFGGSRFWFLCPGCCGRAARLYCSTNYFRCRKCCGLPYTSQMESNFDRAISRREKLRERLEHVVADFYWKPKGMHWRTFETINKRIEAQEAIINSVFVSRFGA
jgi:hypothetical protein